MAQSFSNFTKDFLVKTYNFIIRHPHLHRLSLLPRHCIQWCLVCWQTAAALIGLQLRWSRIVVYSVNIYRCFPHKLHLPTTLRNRRLRTWCFWNRLYLVVSCASDRDKIRHLKWLSGLGLARYLILYRNSIFRSLLHWWVSSFYLFLFNYSLRVDFFYVLYESYRLELLGFNKFFFWHLFLFNKALDFILYLWCCVLQMLQTVTCTSFKSQHPHFAVGQQRFRHRANCLLFPLVEIR